MDRDLLHGQAMRKWCIRIVAVLVMIATVLGVTGWFLARRWQPYVREQVVRYLQDRFGTGVELPDLHVDVSWVSPLEWRTAVLRVTGEGLKLPPVVKVGRFEMEAELGALWKTPRRIRRVRLSQAEFDIPPKEMRRGVSTSGTVPAVMVDTIQMDVATLRIFPSDPAKPPRDFEIHSLTLKGMGAGRAMAYQARLTNPTPPGIIDVTGEFGPWVKDDPGLTPISGKYRFEQADLSVFHAIAGILESSGKFDGVLRRIEVDGETRTPDFRLAGGYAVPLHTRFHSIVDGTSGDTLLEPVRATLGSSHLIARGGVIRPRGAARRRIALDVKMSGGRIEDLLRLAVKSREPFLRGAIGLHTKMAIEPVGGEFSERLLLDGDFDVEESHFTGGSVQSKIDQLSRRAQGHPKDESISDVISSIHGGFSMRDGQISFGSLTFEVPGAAIRLKGMYGLYSEEVDLHGEARLQAKVSQTMTGWKRIALKPVDPFFSKDGSGTLLPIKVVGTREQPQFGLDRKKREAAEE